MYIPRDVPNTPGLIPAFLAGELSSIAREWIQAEDAAFLNTLYTEPLRPREGMLVKADGVIWNPSGGPGLYLFVSGAWFGPLAKFTDLRVIESQSIACSDETTAITAGVGKVTWRAPYALTIQSVRASVTTAPTGSTIIIDINEAGVSVLSTKLSIDASEKTSLTAASAVVISDTAIANDAELTIDFDQVGSTIAGAGVKVTIVWQRT